MPIYPSFRYHATESPRIVREEAEDIALLATGWSDTPAAFAAEPESVPVVVAAEPVPVVSKRKRK